MLRRAAGRFAGAARRSMFVERRHGEARARDEPRRRWRPPRATPRLTTCRLHPSSIDLGLGRVERLLEALGEPQRNLPPVIHVAGTNGTGSPIAFMRAALEAAGKRVHAYTSPHLVSFHERITLGGRAIGEDELAALLREVEEVNGGAPITLFEATTCAALLARARAGRLHTARGRHGRPPRRDKRGGAAPRSASSRR